MAKVKFVTAKGSGTHNGQSVSGAFPLAAANTNTDTQLALDYDKVTGGDFVFDDGSTVTLTVKGLATRTATFKQ